MKRIVSTLVLSVVVFVATLVVTNMYVSRKSIEIADRNNAVALDFFQSELNTDILLTEQSARCFLAGMTSVSLASDSSTVVVEESELLEFKARIHENLSEFMKANKHYTEAMFIIDRDICRDFFGRRECYVPCVKNGDSNLNDLSGRYDFMNSIHYQHVKSERKPYWTAPTATSPVAGKFMTLYIPLLLSNGRYFGAFAISLDTGMINEKLQKHLPYGKKKSSMFIVDENRNVFSASHEWIFDKDFQKNYKQTHGSLKTDMRDSEYQIIDYDGVEYYIYQRKDLLAPWQIYTVCESDAMYENARQFNHILYATSFIGMLIILICSVVISRQIRKNMLLKAAAEEELKMAAKVQMSILKTPQPHLVGGMSLQAFMKPARQAGGDLYDYVEKDGNLIFCIGDVSGKGMPAALFMTQVVSLFRSAVATTSQPEVIASRINDVLAQNNPDMTFCTFFVGSLPMGGGRGQRGDLTFCNAGHNPPVLIHGTPVTPSFLKVRPNIALGLMEGYPYKSETITLGEGDKLLLYTDGITEAKNSSHDEFGDERLLEAISSCNINIIDSVLNAVHSFVGNYEQSDDITLISIDA